MLPLLLFSAARADVAVHAAELPAELPTGCAR